MSTHEPFEVRYRWNAEMFERFFIEDIEKIYSVGPPLRTVIPPMSIAILIGSALALIANWYLGDLDWLALVVCSGVSAAIGCFIGIQAEPSPDKSDESKLRLLAGEPYDLTIKLGAKGLVFKRMGKEFPYPWSMVTEIQEVTDGVKLRIKSGEKSALPDQHLPDGLSRSEAMARIKAWKSA